MGKGTDNLRYREMKTAEGTYIPEIDVEYPEDKSDAHIIGVRYDGRQVTLDENYPYYDNSFKYRFNHALNRCMLHCLVIPVNRVRYGLKIEGKENLRKYKAQLKDGAMTVCNHVYRWDLACVLDAIGNKNLWFPIYGGSYAALEAFRFRITMPGCGRLMPHLMSIVRKRNGCTSFRRLQAGGSTLQSVHSRREHSRWLGSTTFRSFLS